MKTTPPSTPFRTPQAFHAWLEAHHADAAELVVRCFKTHAAGRGMTYSQALDEALCFGWIDGVRRSVDADSFSVRFTPRQEKSKWSAVNVARARVLEREGRMRPPGLVAFRKRSDGDSEAPYSYESRPQELAPAYAKRIRANPRARAFYESQPPWYRRTTAFWVMSAKQEETRLRRLSALIACSEAGRPIDALARAPKTGRASARPKKKR
jgi:uncharacterized protein YdeI (YjbR/CyaY-like superfamily)